MLVITRKKNERILITTPCGEEITIIIPKIIPSSSDKSAKVQIGIQASRDVRIDRAENLSQKVLVTLSNGQKI